MGRLEIYASLIWMELQLTVQRASKNQLNTVLNNGKSAAEESIIKSFMKPL